jgi:imidazolonepropionase-like amidohydrolase
MESGASHGFVGNAKILPQKKGTPMIAIRVGQLVDGTGQEPVHDAVVLVEGERITAVGPAREIDVPSGADVVDASSHTVMPGMIDCHTHIQAVGGPTWSFDYAKDRLAKTQGYLALRAYNNAIKDLEMGFTSIRTVSSPGYVDVALRDAINDGLVAGPRLKAAGQGLCVTGGHMDPGTWAPEVSVWGRTGVADGPWAFRQAVREQLKRGADLIKINAAVSVYSLDYTGMDPYRQEMTYEEMKAVCDEAHMASKRVAAHAHGGQGITDAVQAGLDSVEHAPWLTDEQLEMMADRGVIYVPTLITHTRGLEFGLKNAKSPASWNWLQQVEAARWDTLERAHKIGVTVGVGTDAGFWVYHGENGCELEQLVKGGYTPMEAIVAATSNGAECLDMSKEVGTIQAGKYADLVVIDGDPLSDIRVVQDKAKIVQVFKGGKAVR